MSVRIGSRTFKDYTNLQKYTRNLVNNILGFDCTLKEGDEYFDFFSNLIQRHDYYKEIKGDGIYSFNTYKNWNNTIGMYVITNNKEKNHFSWLKICKKYPKDNHKQDLNNALRHSIHKQIYFYRIINDCDKCSFCKSKNKKIEIDHCGDYEFKDIVDEFLKYNKPPKTFDKCPYTRQKIFKKEDYEFKTKFQIFHSEKAEYQPLCRQCNLKKNFLRKRKEKEEREEKNKEYILTFN